jgi:hypothetical protein
MISEYNIDIKMARDMINNSSIEKMFQSDPYCVLHYSVQCWANDIKNEYEELKQFACV